MSGAAEFVRLHMLRTSAERKAAYARDVLVTLQAASGLGGWTTTVTPEHLGEARRQAELAMQDWASAL